MLLMTTHYEQRHLMNVLMNAPTGNEGVNKDEGSTISGEQECESARVFGNRTNVTKSEARRLKLELYQRWLDNDVRE